MRDKMVIDYKIVVAVIVGVIFFAVLYFAGPSIVNEEWQLWVLFFVNFFIVGIVATGISRGLILNVVLGFVFTIAIIVMSSPQALSNMTQEDIFYLLLYTMIAGASGAVGGYLGTWISRD